MLSTDYIDGIFNYCDRWCERCTYPDRCRLADHERIRRASHRARGVDPDSWEVVLKDVEDDFTTTISLLRDEAERMGIDLDEDAEMCDAQIETMWEETKKHPMYKLAMKLTKMAHEFLEEHCEPILPELSHHAGNGHDARLEDAIEVLSWYHTLIPPKLFRALDPFVPSDEEFERDDSDGSAKIAHLGLVRSLAALQVIQELRPWFRGETIRLMMVVGELIEWVDREFPGHKAFKRPGFDT